MNTRQIKLDAELCQGCRYGCTGCEARIPAVLTCEDCSHFLKCKAFIGVTGKERSCDWIPSKFREAKSAGKQP